MCPNAGSPAANMTEKIRQIMLNIWSFFEFLMTNDNNNNKNKEEVRALEKVMQFALEYIFSGYADDINNEGKNVIHNLRESPDVFTDARNNESKDPISVQRITDSSVSGQVRTGSSFATSSVKRVTVNYTSGSESESHFRKNNINNADVTCVQKGIELSFIFRLRICERSSVIIEEYRNEFISKGQTKSSQHGPVEFRLVVVSMEVFVEAMRQCHAATVVLTHTNVFPNDIRMFISVPVYMHGYINTKDQL